MNRCERLASVIALAGVSAPASATGIAEVFLTFSHEKITPGDVQTAQIWCRMTDLPGGDEFYGFGATTLNVLASANANGAVTSHTIENSLANFGDTTVINDSNLENMFLWYWWQDPSSDNLLLCATFTWETTDYTSRVVDYNIDYSLANGLVGVLVRNSKNKIVSEEWPGIDVGGSFSVVPAPAVLAMLGLGGLIAGRRRR